jgi:hypothetical protein
MAAEPKALLWVVGSEHMFDVARGAVYPPLKEWLLQTARAEASLGQPAAGASSDVRLTTGAHVSVVPMRAAPRAESARGSGAGARGGGVGGLGGMGALRLSLSSRQPTWGGGGSGVGGGGGNTGARMSAPAISSATVSVVTAAVVGRARAAGVGRVSTSIGGGGSKAVVGLGAGWLDASAAAPAGDGGWGHHDAAAGDGDGGRGIRHDAAAAADVNALVKAMSIAKLQGPTTKGYSE